MTKQGGDSMNIGNHIQQIIKKQKSSQKALAEYLNVPKATLSNWLRLEDRSIPSEYIISICKFLKVSPYYLLTGKETNYFSDRLSAEEQKILKYFRELSLEKQQQLISIIDDFLVTYEKQNSKTTITQVIKIRIPVAGFAAGTGISIPLEIDDKFSIQEFNCDNVSDLADCGIPINGVSMEPDFPDGSIVWVQRRQNIRNGDVVIVIINGEPLCKIFDDKVYYSINEKAGFLPIKPTEDDKVVIFGKVVGVYLENDEN